MIKNKVENYIVRPNNTMGDWAYEYSNGSSINSSCDCKNQLIEIQKDIDILKDSIQQVQNVLNNTSVSEATVQHIATIVNNAIDQRINQINSQISDIIQSIPQGLSETINSILSNIDSIRNTVNNVPTYQTMQQYISSLDNISNRLSTTESQISNLQDNYTQLNVTINSLNDILGVLSNNVDSSISALNNHISNSDMHVTAADKLKWDTAASGTITIEVQGRTLVVTQ